MGLKVIPVGQAEYDALAGVLADNDLLAGDLGGDNQRFFAFEDDSGWRVGVGGLELYGDAAILRSFLTMSCHRGQGLGGKMLEELVARAREAGVKTLYLFTEDAAGFFTKYGFMPAERDRAPAAVRQSAQFATHCASADFLMRHL
ncbi:GNAT family N-acetyltransferase [Parapedomonas caeni]